MELDEESLIDCLKTLCDNPDRYNGIIDISIFEDTIYFNTPYVQDDGNLIYYMAEINMSTYKSYIIYQRRKKIEKIRNAKTLQNNRK